VVIASLFIFAVILMSWLVSIFYPGVFLLKLLGDAIALLGAYFLYIIWDKRPIRLRCENCRKIISSNTPWVCGVCKRPNRDAIEYPFVRHCGYEDCGAEPKTYRCHHCEEFVFLTDDEDKINYAYRLNSPTEISKAEERAEKLKSKQEEVEDIDHEINMGRRTILKVQLDERLSEIKKKSNKVLKPVGEAKREGLKEFFDAKAAVKQAAREQKAANAEKHKDNRRARMEDDAIVDLWAQNEMNKGEGEK
jgi:hypothetical protein